MRILMVCTQPEYKVKSPSGVMRRLAKLTELFTRYNEVVFLNASFRNNQNSKGQSDNDSETNKIYYFRQWFAFGKYLSVFTDFNIDYLRQLKRVIKKERIDLVFVTLPYGVASARIICQNTPVIYGAESVKSDWAGMTFQLVENDVAIFSHPFIKSLKRVAKHIFLGYMALLERLACRTSRHIVAISQADKQRFMEKFGLAEDRITVIAPHIDSNEFRESFSGGRTGKAHTVQVVFHGVYTHPPNYEAFQLIQDYIAPEVGKHRSNIQFVLAGVDVPAFEQGNVKSLGFVEDIGALLRDCDIAIMPVLRGGGVKVKILDYMAAGLPIISTKNGIEGIVEAENDEHALIVDTVDQKFIDAILDLASDGKKREMIGRNALELAKTRYSQESMQARVDEMLTYVKKEVVRKKNECAS